MIQLGQEVQFNRPGKDGAVIVTKGRLQEVWKRNGKEFGKVLEHGARPKMWRVRLRSLSPA